MKKEKLPKFENLEHFRDWVLNDMPILGFVPLRRKPIVSSYMDDDQNSFHFFCLYDDGEYRVDMVGTSGESNIKPHRHPDVDSYEVFMGGELVLHMEDKEVGNNNENNPQVWYNGTHPMRGAWNRFTPETIHYGHSGKRGAIFLSIQRWHKRKDEDTLVENVDVKFFDKIENKG